MFSGAFLKNLRTTLKTLKGFAEVLQQWKNRSASKGSLCESFHRVLDGAQRGSTCKLAAGLRFRSLSTRVSRRKQHPKCHPEP